MQPLCDAIVDLVVADVLREMESENAIGGADQANRRGVKDERCKDYHASANPTASGASTSQ